MFIGGQLIKEFDAFLHLFRSAAEALHSQVEVPADDQFALNRVLAGLGGPPAPSHVTLTLQSASSLPALCLFLLMHREHCPIFLGSADSLARLKQFTHIVAHALVPMAGGGNEALQVEEVVSLLTETSLGLHPVVTYSEDSEVAAVQVTGGNNWVETVPGGGPFKVVMNPPGEVLQDRDGPLHPMVVPCLMERDDLWLPEAVARLPLPPLIGNTFPVQGRQLPGQSGKAGHPNTEVIRPQTGPVRDPGARVGSSARYGHAQAGLTRGLRCNRRSPSGSSLTGFS